MADSNANDPGQGKPTSQRDSQGTGAGRVASGNTGRRGRGIQQGARHQAEGEHGPITHARHIDQLHEGKRGVPLETRVAREHRNAALRGKRRLVEDRQQHDQSEKDSERTRLFVAHKRGWDGTVEE